MAVDARRALPRRPPRARLRDRDDLGAGGHDRRVVRHDEDASDRAARPRRRRRASRRRPQPAATTSRRRFASPRYGMTTAGTRRRLRARSRSPFEPGPDVAHSRTSNQCVPRSASATSMSVWPGLKTWCSRSQQISTSPSDDVRDARERLRGKLRLGDRVVLELQVGVELHQLGPVGTRAGAHRGLQFSSSIHVPSKRTTPRMSSPG